MIPARGRCLDVAFFPKVDRETGVPQEKTEAVVLRGVDYSETSRIVTFLTPARGRIACIGKGARRKNSALAGVLDTFNRVELVYYWKEGREVHPLAEATLTNGFPALKSSLERSCYAQWPVELTYRVAHENEPSESLFLALTEGLAGLSHWPGSARLHACWQVLRLLAAAGFAPSTRQCVRCSSPVAEGPLGFALEGGVVCGACPADGVLTQAGHRLLCVLQEAASACPKSFPERPEAAERELFDTLAAYAAYQLESDFKSVRVLKQVFG